MSKELVHIQDEQPDGCKPAQPRFRPFGFAFRVIRYLFGGTWRLLVATVLVASLLFNILLLFSDAVQLAAATAIASATGVRTLIVSQADEIANLRRVKEKARDATRKTAESISRRMKSSSTRKVAAMSVKAVPVLGVVAIAGLTVIEINEMCDTVTELTELQRVYEPELEIPDEQVAVCGLDVPSQKEILTGIQNSPRDALQAAKNLFAETEEFQDWKFPEIDWDTFETAIIDNLSSWESTFTDFLGESWDRLRIW